MTAQAGDSGKLRRRSRGSLHGWMLFLVMAESRNSAQIMSPCRSVCKMSEQTGLCIGCLRTIDEIALWGQMSSAEREQVLRQIQQRAGHWNVETSPPAE